MHLQALVIMCDFNFHVDNFRDTEACRVCRVLQSLDDRHLKQHVKEPTHIRGPIPGLIIIRSSSKMRCSHHSTCYLHLALKKNIFL